MCSEKEFQSLCKVFENIQNCTYQIDQNLYQNLSRSSIDLLREADYDIDTFFQNLNYMKGQLKSSKVRNDKIVA